MNPQRCHWRVSFSIGPLRYDDGIVRSLHANADHTVVLPGAADEAK